MNKKSLPLIIILTLTAGGLLYAKSRPTSISIAPDSQTPEQIMTEAQKFAQAVESGQPYTCQITGPEVALEYQIMGDKMYLTNQTDQIISYAINDSTYLYSWNNQSANGSKMKMPTKEEMQEMNEDLPETPDAPSFSGEQDYQAYQDQGYTINCQPADFDQTLFTPPSDITFIDPTAMMQEVMPDGETLDMAKLQEMAKDYEGMMPTDN